VYLDEKTGVIAANPGSGNKLFFEMSTIEASITREVGKQIMDAGFGTYFDSPISVSLTKIQVNVGWCPWSQRWDFIIYDRTSS
jgi:3-hydroxyisobutyrate dehydrogenase-like beta-hydroxyacid dehydrogenase